jgi:hypothetical protein
MNDKDYWSVTPLTVIQIADSPSPPEGYYFLAIQRSRFHPGGFKEAFRGHMKLEDAQAIANTFNKAEEIHRTLLTPDN